jgi:hypothetical protein
MFPFRPFFSGRSRRRNSFQPSFPGAFFFCSSPRLHSQSVLFILKQEFSCFQSECKAPSGSKFVARCEPGWKGGGRLRALRGSQVKNYSVFGTSSSFSSAHHAYAVAHSSTLTSLLHARHRPWLATSPWSAERIISALFYF